MEPNGVAVTLTVTEAAGVLGISRGLAYSCANRFIESDGAEGLPVVRLGRRLVVPTYQLNRLLSGELSLGGRETTPVDPAPPETPPARPSDAPLLGPSPRRRRHRASKPSAAPSAPTAPTAPTEPITAVQLSLLPLDPPLQP